MKRFSSLLAGLVGLSLLLTACGPTATPTAVPPGGPSLDDNLIKDPQPTIQGGDVDSPMDATPSLDAKTIFFTASSSKGQGVFQVPATGGEPTALMVGSPFVAPRTLALNPAGDQLYVADPGASAGGVIFVLPVTGGTPSPLPGAKGMIAQNLTLVSEGGQTALYFTGTDPATAQPAVLKLAPPDAASAQVVAKGAPLAAPDGITVTAGGVIYVTDRGATGKGDGQVFKITADGKVQSIVRQVRMGNPAGTALAGDDSLLLVSAVQPDRDSARVLVVNLATLQTGEITKVVGQNSGAGGLHRSPGVATAYAWCGAPRQVYNIDGQ